MVYFVDNQTAKRVKQTKDTVFSEEILWFTDALGELPTIPQADWYNMIQGEMLGIADALGVTPDKLDDGQLGYALKEAFKKVNLDIKNLPKVLDEYGESKKDAASQRLVNALKKYVEEVDNKTQYSSKQNRLFARFMRKLKVDGGAKINCVGTSNTEKRRDYISYPEFLEEALNDVYQNDVSVENLGVGGGTVESVFQKWKDNTPDADLTIMEFTANDQGRTEIGKFVDDLEKYIEYELDANRAVMLVTAPKMDATININRDIYSAAMYGVANKYSIYIIDAEILGANYPKNIRYDGIHATTEGNNVLGYKIAATLTGEGIQNPRTVVAGSSLLGRPTIDSLIFGANTRQYRGSDNPPITPIEGNMAGGVTANFSGKDGTAQLYYAFYAESDNLYITPNIKLYSGADVKFTLDGGLVAPRYSLTNGIAVDTSIIIAEDHTYYYKNESDGIQHNSNQNRLFDPIPLVTAGWHILKIEVNHDTAVLYGLEFHNSTKIDLDSYSSKQSRLFARFLKKLKVDGGAKINCVGTANTSSYEGYKSYPEFLEEALNDVYQNDVSVVNMGIEGGRVIDNYNKWKDNTPDAHLTIMEFTAGDQSRTEISKFVEDLERYIEYELDCGRAVMLVTAPKTTSTVNINRDVYSAAMYTVARKYSLYIVDAEFLLANYSTNIYLGTIVLKDEANNVLGYKIAATLTGEGIQNPRTVMAGSSLLGRPTIDSLIFGKNTRQYRGSEIPPITPDENAEVQNSGVTASFAGENGKAQLYYAFYAESDNLYITPNIKLYSGADVKFTLDGGLVAPRYSLTNGIAVDTSIIIAEDHTYYYKNESDGIQHNSNQNRLFDPIPLVTAGWHILKIEVENNIGVLYGLEFHNSLKQRKWRDVKNERLLNVDYINDTDAILTIDVTINLGNINFPSTAELLVDDKPVSGASFSLSGSAMNYVAQNQIYREILPGQRYQIKGDGAGVGILYFEELKL